MNEQEIEVFYENLCIKGQRVVPFRHAFECLDIQNILKFKGLKLSKINKNYKLTPRNNCVCKTLYIYRDFYLLNPSDLIVYDCSTFIDFEDECYGAFFVFRSFIGKEDGSYKNNLKNLRILVSDLIEVWNLIVEQCMNSSKKITEKLEYQYCMDTKIADMNYFYDLRISKNSSK